MCHLSKAPILSLPRINLAGILVSKYMMDNYQLIQPLLPKGEIRYPRILLGESYNGIRALADLSVCVNKCQQAFWRRCRGSNRRKYFLYLS